MIFKENWVCLNIKLLFGENLSEYKLFVQRIGLVGITNILVALSTIILLPVLTKNLGANGYGIWIQVNTTIALISSFATLGLPYTLIRFLSAEKEREKIQEGFYSIATAVLLVGFLTSSLLFIFSKPIAMVLFGGNVGVTQLMAVITFFACLNALLLDYFRTFQEMKKYSIFLIIQTYLVVLLVSYSAFSGQDIINVVMGLLIAYIVVFMVMIYVIISKIGFKIPEFKNMKEYLSFGLPTIPGGLSFWIVESSDRYLIALFLGTAFVGYYSPGYTLGNVILMFLAPFLVILPSVLPEYYDNGEMEKVKTFLKYSLKYFLLVAIPTVFALSLLSKPILTLLTTSDIALNGYLVTPFVALSALLSGIYGIMVNMLILKKKTKIMGIIWIVAAFLNIGLNIILIPYIGIIGAAIVTLIAYSFASTITVFYSLKNFEFKFDLGFILKSIIASILMSFVIVAFNPEGILSVTIVIGLCIIVYILSILILKGIKRKEIEFFRQMFQKKIF
jgi:O-antigen/teichoic acid export membrane protein